MSQKLSGFGVGFRPQHYAWVTENLPAVDWFEVISENFMAVGGKSRRFLEKLRSHYPVATHGLGLSVGSSAGSRGSNDSVDFVYLRQLKELLDWLEPALVSDHLCWSSFRESMTHDLLPIPFTELSLKAVASKVNQIQDFLGRQISLENPSAYLQFKESEMSESTFLAQLCAMTGCGVLLDVNNAYVNWKNLKRNPRTYFDEIPESCVHQFHLAGHCQSHGVWIDTHDEPICPEVWELYALAAAKWPEAAVLIEWDEKLPNFETLMAEVERARSIRKTVTSMPAQLELNFSPGRLSQVAQIDVFPEAPSLGVQSGVDPRVYQDAQLKGLLDLIRQRGQITDETSALSAFDSKLPVRPKKGAAVYQAAYFQRLCKVLVEVYPTLYLILGKEGFTALATDYLVHFPPRKHSILHAADRLSEYLRTYGRAQDLSVPAAALADLALLEWTRTDLFERPDDKPSISMDCLQRLLPEEWERVRFRWIDALSLLELDWDVGPTWQSPIQVPGSFLVYRRNDEVYHRKLSAAEAVLFKEMLQGHSFLQGCEALLEMDPTQTMEQTIPIAVKFLGRWVTDQLITQIDSNPL